MPSFTTFNCHKVNGQIIKFIMSAGSVWRGNLGGRAGQGQTCVVNARLAKWERDEGSRGA